MTKLKYIAKVQESRGRGSRTVELMHGNLQVGIVNKVFQTVQRAQAYADSLNASESAIDLAVTLALDAEIERVRDDLKIARFEVEVFENRLSMLKDVRQVRINEDIDKRMESMK